MRHASSTCVHFHNAFNHHPLDPVYVVIAPSMEQELRPSFLQIHFLPCQLPPEIVFQTRPLHRFPIHSFRNEIDPLQAAEGASRIAASFATFIQCLGPAGHISWLINGNLGVLTGFPYVKICHGVSLFNLSTKCFQQYHCR